MSLSGLTLNELAAVVGGRVLGDAAKVIDRIRPLDTAEASDLSFLHKANLRGKALASRAGAILVPASLSFTEHDFNRPLLEVTESSVALAQLIRHLNPRVVPLAGIHPTAVVGEGCEISETASVGPYAVIGEGSKLGDKVEIAAHVVVGRQCVLGDGVRLHPNVVLYDQTILGHSVEIHAGAVIGADGFGYASSQGVHHKIPQVGQAVLGDNVEIGANSTIDRALLEETTIGAGTKIDNLVHVGHNVTTGRGCILCGQSGIAGSTSLGDFVVLGGQTGVVDHRKLGSQVQVAAKSAVFNDIESSQMVGGIPAIALSKYRRQAAVAGRLPDIAKRLRRLERRLDELEDERGGE